MYTCTMSCVYTCLECMYINQFLPLHGAKVYYTVLITRGNVTCEVDFRGKARKLTSPKKKSESIKT